MALKLTFSSGRQLIEFDFVDDQSDTDAISRFLSCQALKVLAGNDPAPVYGHGYLTVVKGDTSPLTIKSDIAQTLLDHYNSSAHAMTYTCKIYSFDPALKLLYLSVDLGLPAPENIPSLQQLACQNCLTRQDSHTDVEPHRTNSSDVVHTLMFCHIYNHDEDGWISIHTADAFTRWQKRFPNNSATGPQLNAAWKNIKHDSNKDRFGLAFAIFKLHDEEQQQAILELSFHECTLTQRCMLNDFLMQPEWISKLPSDFDDYLKLLFSQYFIKTYFPSKRSQLGLSILATMPPNPVDEWQDHPLQSVFELIPDRTDPNWIKKPLLHAQKSSTSTTASSPPKKK